MKIKKSLFILSQIALLSLFASNAAHAFANKCKGPVPSTIGTNSCSSCHNGSFTKATYNGVCDVMGNTGGMGMNNPIPQAGMGSAMRHHNDDDDEHYARRHHDDDDHDKKHRGMKRDHHDDDHGKKHHGKKKDGKKKDRHHEDD